jgi:hypothetical protein
MGLYFKGCSKWTPAFVFVGLLLLGVFYICLQVGFLRRYDISILNKTGTNISRVAIYSGGKAWGMPTSVVIGGEATQGWITDPIPNSVEFKMLIDGEQKTVTVSLNGVSKYFWNGTIYFIVNRDGVVKAQALKSGDMAGYMELIKGLRPDGEYRFAFVNRTGNDLHAVTVYYGEQKVGAGNEIPAMRGANFSYSDPLTTPCPEDAEVRWVEAGVPYAVKVRLDQVPTGFESEILFVIKSADSVEVYLVKNGDDKAAFELIK